MFNTLHIWVCGVLQKQQGHNQDQAVLYSEKSYILPGTEENLMAR